MERIGQQQAEEEKEECLMNFLDSSELIFQLQSDEAVTATKNEVFYNHGVDSSSLSSDLVTTSSSTSSNAKEATCSTHRSRKKQKKDVSTIKVRKDKLRDKISALQQLVSPFGKSDTASVLHEALGYIRFLHDQVQVLVIPYMQGLPTAASLQGYEVEGLNGDLRSRGLCLVPVSCTEDATNNNGADLWSSVKLRRTNNLYYGDR